MAKFSLIAFLVFLCAGCSASRPQRSYGDSRSSEVAYLDENAYLLTTQSVDKSYGFSEANPIKVGGSRENSGPKNERRFLNSLLGPNGERIHYFREGSCCSFKTPNGLFDKTGMLDRYKVYWEGGSDTLTIYVNMYDKGNLQIPVGLSARKQ